MKLTKFRSVAMRWVVSSLSVTCYAAGQERAKSIDQASFVNSMGMQMVRITGGKLQMRTPPPPPEGWQPDDSSPTTRTRQDPQWFVCRDARPAMLRIMR